MMWQKVSGKSEMDRREILGGGETTFQGGGEAVSSFSWGGSEMMGGYHVRVGAVLYTTHFGPPRR